MQGVTSKITWLSLALGVLLGGVLVWWLLPAPPSAETAANNEPLYWVAPMDANYRRDQPGKSPMGMDLVPVYAEGGMADSPGTVRISPAVVNNLGVRTALAERRVLPADIQTVGYVQYDQESLVHMHPRVEGWVETLAIKTEGDPIEKGQPLYALYSPQLVNAQEEFVSALARGNATLIEAARARLRALHLGADFIKQLEADREVRRSIVFRAPQTGVAVNLMVREGHFVKPGDVLLSIAQLDPVWVEAEVFARQASLIEAGLPVTLRLDYLPGRSWQGEVDYVYPNLDADTRTLGVRLRFANPDHSLKPNMFAQVSIHGEGEGERLVIPREALIQTGAQERVVLALGDGRFRSVVVQSGRKTSDAAIILSGLKEGDRVVTSGQFLIDSESSKSADFQRMEGQSDAADINNETRMGAMGSSATDENMAGDLASENTETGDAISLVWVEVQVEEVRVAQRQLKLDHPPIPEWNWPQMTMNFNLAEAVDIASLQAGMTVHAQLSRAADNSYRVEQIHILAPDAPGMEGSDTEERARD